MKWLVLLLLLLPGPAMAQAPQTPAQIAIQIDTIINQWAQALESAQKQIDDLKKENADLKARIDSSQPAK